MTQEVTRYPGIGLPLEAVKGTLISHYQVEDALLRWEGIRNKVIRQMPQKGFTREAVEAALGQCDKMLDFYDELLEKYE